MKDTPHLTRVGPCTQCGKGAAWNTPALDPDGNLWCNHCADHDETGTILRGVEQHLHNGSYAPSRHGVIYYNRVVVWNDMAWFNGGMPSCPLTPEEREAIKTEEGRIETAKALAAEWASGIRRCTRCETRIQADEIADCAANPMAPAVVKKRPVTQTR